jgi:acetamidase/formamidase
MARYELDASSVHYTWSPDHDPIVRVRSGDELSVLTRDGFDGQFDDMDPVAFRDSISALDFDRIAPLTGPIFVEDAEPGSTLEVEILSLEPVGDGHVVVWPEWCGFDFHRPAQTPASGSFLRIAHDDLVRDRVRVGGLRVPARPMLGIVGTAPARGVLPTLPPREFGGNMDCRLVGAGAVLSLPVFQHGALLSLGDGHAAQGDGEICTTGIECAMRVSLRVNVNRNRSVTRPELRRNGSHTILAYARDLDTATHEAIERMHRHLVECTELDGTEAYMFIGLAGDLEINQVVDTPHVGVRLTVPLGEEGT